MNDLMMFQMLFDCDPPGPVAAAPAVSPLDSELFDFEKVSGAGDQLCKRLHDIDFVERLLDIPIAKLREGLFVESATPASISTLTYDAEPLPTPEPFEEIADVPARCSCKCSNCTKDDHARCSAGDKCSLHPRATKTAHHLAIARICERVRGRLGYESADIDSAWKGIEGAMVKFVGDAVSAEFR